MPIRMLPPTKPDNRIAELNAILAAPRDLVQSVDPPTGAARENPPPRQMRLAFSSSAALVESVDRPRAARYPLSGASLSATHRRIESNMAAAANATIAGAVDRTWARQFAEAERMAVVEADRERQLLAEAERYAEIAYRRAKGAA